MMRALLLVLMICVSPLLAQKPETIMGEPPSRAHVSNSFSFTVNAAMHDAAPLFGPEGERVWAGDDWNPQFVFPIPARDVEGAVFTVRHGEDEPRIPIVTSPGALALRPKERCGIVHRRIYGEAEAVADMRPRLR